MRYPFRINWRKVAAIWAVFVVGLAIAAVVGY